MVNDCTTTCRKAWWKGLPYVFFLGLQHDMNMLPLADEYLLIGMKSWTWFTVI